MFNIFVELLALAVPPKGSASILDWRPFLRGKTLNEIIDRYNTRCMKKYEEFGLFPEYIESIAQGIKAVRYDLSTVKQLRRKHFAQIRIIVMDLDAIGERQDEINMIKLSIAGYFQPYFLVQVSLSYGSKSRLSAFKGLPVFPSRPEIMRDEKSFETWLSEFCITYLHTLANIPPPPSPDTGDEIDRKASQTYFSALPTIISQVRDAAITRHLSTKKINMLAHQTAMQEFALARLAAQLYTPTRYHVVLDTLREPAYKMELQPTIRSFRPRRTNLLALTLAIPLEKLEPEGRKIVFDLGVRGKSFTAVHFDKPALRDVVGRLEGVINATEFSADLPSS